MKFFKWSYLISAFMLMAFHSHTDLLTTKNLSFSFQTHSKQKLSQSNLPEKNQSGNDVLFELEEDDDDESKNHGKSIITNGIANNYLIFKHFDLVASSFSYQKPILFYKSSQSYLEVFRI
jgi:hypothetical protein